MRTSYKIFVLTISILLTSLRGNSQYITDTYRDELKAVVNMDSYNDPFAFSIQYKEAPYPGGEDESRAFLRKIKLEAQVKTPLHTNPFGIEPRGEVPVPEILASFSGNNIITGTPLDNHLAVNTTEQVVSTINTHMIVVNNVGFFQGSYLLDAFFQTLEGVDRYFDPRVIYDPEQDRFILVLMQGSQCFDSRILIAFSKTNNPKGAWNMYALDGCLDEDGTFADYPMISLTDSELFLTYNEVNADSSWQTGFGGTQIHQIDKMSGYNGETLNRKVWRDIRFNGKLLRNICPVRNADESLPLDMYFLSDRNFSISNDSVFLMHLTGHYDDPNASLDMELRKLDQPYGFASYAVQPKDSLDTNDARILDAFAFDGHIQWVNNTMDFNTGRSGVFHGLLVIDDPSFTATGHIIGHPTDYLGYPGIAWTGTKPGEQDAIIVMSHSSSIRFPGGSAFYSNGLGEYSNIITIIEGKRSIDMLTGPIERWGDYVGIQRLYHQPGSVWIACSYGRPGSVNEAWIAKLTRHEEMVGTHLVSGDDMKTTAYPNPTDDYVTMEIDNPAGGKITVTLFNHLGQPLKTLYDGAANYPGKASLNFSTHELSAGQYEVQVQVDGITVATRSIVRQ
ncbi:MAG TPA: T9SS type A sorting domain-containing protein [Saprospiraceae bacterium]|nr:T9SS type A sorting domain-containing protein [Saprospiraceae bacterium]